MKSIFGKKMVEVISGNAARNIGKLATNLFAIAVGNGFKSLIDFRSSSAFADETVEVIRARGTYPHALTAVGEDFERLDVVVRFAGHDRVDAAGIIPDHASDRATVVAGRVGRKGQVMFFGGSAQCIEHDAGLHPSNATGRIDFQ